MVSLLKLDLFAAFCSNSYPNSCECNIWFDETEKFRNSLFSIFNFFRHTIETAEEDIDVTISEPNMEESNTKKRKREATDKWQENEFSHFKNVRLVGSLEETIHYPKIMKKVRISILDSGLFGSRFRPGP